MKLTNHNFMRYEDNHDSNTLIIAFSHVGYPAGKFAYTNAISHIQCKKLFVNCEDNSWYQEGILGMRTIDDLVEFFKDFIIGIGPVTVITLGMSMGGYASILFGLKIKADFILAFTAEITLGETFSRSYTENKKKIYDYKYVSLVPLLQYNTSSKVFLIYGNEDLIDLSLLWPISNLIRDRVHLNLFFVSGNHQVTLKLNVPLILSNLIANHTLSAGVIESSLCLKHSYNETEFLLYKEIYKLKLNADWIGLKRILEHDMSITKSRSVLCWVYGVTLTNLNLHKQAYDIYKLGLQIDHHSYELWHSIAGCYFALGDYIHACDSYNKALALQPNAFMSHIRLGDTYIRLNLLEDANYHYGLCKSMYPNHVELLKRINT